MGRRRPRPAAGVGAKKGGSVPQPTAKPAKPAIRAGQALGLTIFVATAAFLTALLISGAGTTFDSVQKAAVSFSTLCAAVAAFVMLLDAADLWVRGRKMTAYSVKMFRSLVFIAVLGALAASLFGGNSLVIVFLAPAMIVYLVITRKNPNTSRAAAAGSARSGSRSGSSVPSGGGRPTGSHSKSRQRKGGKKHR
jgi:hypothetical protein